MGEQRQEFERELEAIEAKVIELFAMVAEDLPGATDALLSGNSEVIKALTEREQAIDALYPEIEGMANREILLQAPVASDLRFLLSVLRVVRARTLPRPRRTDRHPGQPYSQRRPLAALPRARRADGEPRIRHVAPGSGLLVPARSFHRGHTCRTR